MASDLRWMIEAIDSAMEQSGLPALPQDAQHIVATRSRPYVKSGERRSVVALMAPKAFVANAGVLFSVQNSRKYDTRPLS